LSNFPAEAKSYPVHFLFLSSEGQQKYNCLAAVNSTLHLNLDALSQKRLCLLEESLAGLRSFVTVAVF